MLPGCVVCSEFFSLLVWFYSRYNLKVWNFSTRLFFFYQKKIKLHIYLWFLRIDNSKGVIENKHTLIHCTYAKLTYGKIVESIYIWIMTIGYIILFVWTLVINLRTSWSSANSLCELTGSGLSGEVKVEKVNASTTQRGQSYWIGAISHHTPWFDVFSTLCFYLLSV